MDTIRTAHLRRRYLPYSETFLHALIAGTPAVEAQVATEVAENLDAFPADVRYVVDAREYAALKQRHGRSGREALMASMNYPGCFERHFRERKVDLVHAHFGPVGVDALGLTRRLGVPMVVSFYGIDASARLRHQRVLHGYRQLFRSADRVLALGTRMARRLVEAGCDRDRVKILRLGVNLSSIPYRRRVGSRVPTVLFCGRLVEKKGAIDLIEAGAILAAAGRTFRLRIVGSGPLRGLLERRIRTRGLQGRVTLTGALEHRRVFEEMDAADIFVLPSREARNGDREGTPNVLLEAQAAGLPVVSTRHADIPEIVRENASALLVEPGHVRDLAAAIASLLDSQPAWEAMGTAGRDHVAANHCIEKQGARLRAIYGEVLGAASDAGR